MKQKIKHFLLRKRFFKGGIKVLKNKKGFSLLEILVAVAIIGIITSIAVPSYRANRKEAAKVAGMTSINNIYKAYQNCTVLKAFTDCNTLSGIGISCPDCHSSTAGTKFCAHIEKESGGKKFFACVGVDGDTVSRTIGGTLFDDIKICHDKERGATSWPTTWSVMTNLKFCSQKTECGQDDTTNTAGSKKYECIKSTGTGKCASGECS